MTGTQTPRIELYVRSLSPLGANQYQERLVDRLHRLAEQGAISGFSVTVWGGGLGIDTAMARTERGRRIRKRIAAFRQWARTENVSLESLERREVSKHLLTEETVTVLDFPVMMMAEYADEELLYVTPFSVDGAVRTVSDRLDHLESEGVPTPNGAKNLESAKEPRLSRDDPAETYGAITHRTDTEMRRRQQHQLGQRNPEESL
jgi:hypothetical protein